MPDTAKPTHSGTEGPATDVHQVVKNGARRKRPTGIVESNSKEGLGNDKRKVVGDKGAGGIGAATASSCTEATSKEAENLEDTALDNGSDSTEEQTTLVEGEVSSADSSSSPTGPDTNHTEHERPRVQPEVTNKTRGSNNLPQVRSKYSAGEGSSSKHKEMNRSDGNNSVIVRSKFRPPKHAAHGAVRDFEVSLCTTRAMSASPRILRASEPREDQEEEPSASKNHAPSSARNTMYASLQSLNRLNFRTDPEKEEPTVLGMSQVLWKKVESKATGFFFILCEKKGMS